jgi:hypothetical protein
MDEQKIPRNTLDYNSVISISKVYMFVLLMRAILKGDSHWSTSRCSSPSPPVNNDDDDDDDIGHIISACPILTKEQYRKRRDRVCAQLHFNICKETGVQLDKKHWYEHVPKSVEIGQGGNITILWNQQVQTDRAIPNNKPDIIIHDNEKRTCIDVAISGDRNVIKKKPRKF